MFDNVKLAEEVVASGAENRPRIIGSTASLWVSTGCGKHRDVEDQGCSGSPGGWLQNKPEGGPGWNLARVRRAVSAVREAEVRGGLPGAPGAPHGVVRAAGGMGTRPDRTGPGPIVGGRPFQSRGRTRTVPIADHSLVPSGPECRRAASAGAGVTRWKPPPHASISVR